MVLAWRRVPPPVAQSCLPVIVMSWALTPTPTMVGWSPDVAGAAAPASAVKRLTCRSCVYSWVSTLAVPGAAAGATARRDPRRRRAGAAGASAGRFPPADDGVPEVCCCAALVCPALDCAVPELSLIHI